MKQITRLMINEYRLKNFDFMGYRLIKNQATFHHIVKRENGGKETIDNGAILMPAPHQYLHLIECKDIGVFEALNRILLIINRQQTAPTIEQLRIISAILHTFEDEHKNDKNSKGKVLIKHQYKDRLYY